MKLKRIILEYFTFTKNERRGLFVLLSLIVLFLLANHFIFYFETPAKVNPKEFEQLIALLEESEANDAIKRGTLFPFDPNSIDSIQLDSLLLPVQVKQNLLKYRSKGGKLYKAKDFRKIYGMNDSIYEAVCSYVVIRKKESKSHVPPVIAINIEGPQVKTIVKEISTKEEARQPIDLNAATEEELKSLKGIGDVLSKRILKYRELLGGFYSLEQLHEVYGLKSETINYILPYLELKSSNIRRINVNFADASELAKHPYINWELANKIVDFRSRNGFIQNLEVILSNNLMNEADFKRITPYLRLKN